MLKEVLAERLAVLGGGAAASQLGQRGILPRFLLPKYLQVQKGFEIIDNQGKRRLLLDKASLTSSLPVIGKDLPFPGPTRL